MNREAGVLPGMVHTYSASPPPAVRWRPSQSVRPFGQGGLFITSVLSHLENFAAQAIIAMENARLLTETREALMGNSQKGGLVCFGLLAANKA